MQHSATLQPTTLHYTPLHFILSISLLIIFHILLLRPSLHCITSPHFTQLHFTKLRCTSAHFTQLHYTYRHFTTLSFSFDHLHFLSFYFISRHYNRHRTVLISKRISKIINPFPPLKNFSIFHFRYNLLKPTGYVMHH